MNGSIPLPARLIGAWAPARRIGARHRPARCQGCGGPSRELLDAAGRVDRVHGRCRACRAAG